MKLALVISLLLVLKVTCDASSTAPNVRMRYARNLTGFGDTAFMEQPRTIEEAKNMGYLLRDRNSSLPLSSCPMYCTDDLIACFIFDEYLEILIAIQLGLPLSRTYGIVLDYETQGMTKWSTTFSNGTAEDLQCITAYFVPPLTYLDAPGEERAASYDYANVLQNGTLWLTSFNGSFISMTDSAEGALAANFTKQGCIDYMGNHYFYQMYSNTTCTSSTILPWFVLVKEGVLHGFVLGILGNIADVANTKSRFEVQTLQGVKAVISDGPQCLYDLATSPGLTTMHTYFRGAADINSTLCS